MGDSLDGTSLDNVRVVYRHERPTCPALDRPVFRARPVDGDVPGQPRWVRSFSDLASDHPFYVIDWSSPPRGIIGLTASGTSIWGDEYSNRIGLSHATGSVLYTGVGSGPILWLTDGIGYSYGGSLVGGGVICEDGNVCSGSAVVGVEEDQLRTSPGPTTLTYPAWSPLTRGVVARAGNDLLYAGCTDGQAHWMLQLPPVRAVNAGLYVRESGEIVFVADTSYVFSPDGEVLRQNTIDALSLGLYNTSAATFVEGCGALLVGNDRWAWLDAETLTLGPPIVIPGGYPAFSSFTATQDCGVAAVVNPVVPTLMRFSREGDVLWGVPTATSRAPFALDDGGFLVIAVGGYQIVDADGNVRETVRHEAPIASCSFEATLAPDGTLFRVCAGDSPLNPYVAAIPTGVRPWGLYGPGEGIDFAHTNAPPAR
jgi:hypothetical protein